MGVAITLILRYKGASVPEIERVYVPNKSVQEARPDIAAQSAELQKKMTESQGEDIASWGNMYFRPSELAGFKYELQGC